MNVISPSSSSGRIAPSISEDTAFFWQGLSQGRLLAQRCADCSELRHPPGPVCPHCHSLAWEEHELSGEGVIFSYSIHHYPKVPGFDQPNIVAIIDLAEGVRLVSNIVEADPNLLKIGAPVEVSYVAQQEGWTAHQFRRSGEQP